MTTAIDLPKLYRGRVNVWVEDTLTSEYLKEVWAEPRILFLISGSGDAIRPAVHDARRNGLRNVFGIADRDFGDTNVDRWRTPGVYVFVLPVHEMENYLLDPISLAASEANTNDRPERGIEQRLRRRAEAILWWMACRRVIKRLRSLCWDDFISLPRPADVASLNSAQQHIVTTEWYKSIVARVDEIRDPELIASWIGEAAGTYQFDLASAEWLRSFAGKELLADVRGFIYDPPRPATPSQRALDLAKSVGRWQLHNGRVPPELADLLEVIRAEL